MVGACSNKLIIYADCLGRPPSLVSSWVKEWVAITEGVELSQWIRFDQFYSTSGERNWHAVEQQLRKRYRKTTGATS